MVDVRSVVSLPPSQRVHDVLVLTPAELICAKLLSMASRPKTAKGLMDAADLRRLLLAFPEFHVDPAHVRERLISTGAGPNVLEAWQEVSSQEILSEEEGDKFGDE